MASKSLNSSRILKKEMQEAIKKSGYLIEQRVESVLQEGGYYVDANPDYKDLSTGKTREYDISAITGTQIFKELSFVYTNRVCKSAINHLKIFF